MSSAATTALQRNARQFGRIPQELKDDPSWVLWKYERRREKPDKLTKVLYQVSDRYADSTRPATWTTFEAVLSAYKRGGFDGIGFVFHPDNPYCGADLDDAAEAEAQGWFDRFGSYAECSPSGNGYHIICKAEVPKGTNREEGELYSSGRFFTMTGDVVNDAPVREAQDAADEFYAFLRRGDADPTQRSAAPSGLTDAEVVSLAEGARNGGEFGAVYRGGGQFKSGSERDLSLASRLAFYTQDEAQIERIMRGSGCVREKWDKHRTYLRDTIAKALEGLTESYTPPAERARTAAASSSVDSPAEDPAGEVVHVSFNGHGEAQRPPRGYQFTDLGNAERFLDMHHGRVLWCPTRKSFLIWDGKRYEWDDRGEAVKLAHQTARGIHREAADAESADAQKAITKWALASQNESRINAMLSQSKPYLAVGMDELDRDQWLVNCQNGTLDLRTGRLKDHDPADRITKIVPTEYAPGSSCVRFERFLKEALVDDALVEFVKRYAGYTLTGITRERMLAILYGFGKNGKTTLVELLHEVLGDYARNTDVETLLIKKYQGVGNDVAALKGARFVSAAEVEKGRRLAESKVKQLTGRDTVTARFLFGENFDFRPEFKLWLSTNNKPVIQGTDDAIWDRIRLIPFTQRFEGDQADPKLPDKLREELPGVFAWMVEGCLEWQEHGLEEPETVTKATLRYREEMDTLAAFVEDRCVLVTSAVAPATPLYNAYREWCVESGEKPETQKMFGMRLRERGFRSEKIPRGPHKDRKGWLGIGIRADDADPEGEQQSTSDAERPAPEGADRPLGEPLADDRPPTETRTFAGDLSNHDTGADHSGPKNQNPPHAYPRVEKDVEKRSASSASSADEAARGHREHTPDGTENDSEGPEINSPNSQTHRDPEGWTYDAGEDLEGLEDLFEDDDGRAE